MTRALIVEDNPRILETVVDVVESLGHGPVTACCQEEARGRLEESPFGYALLDLEIPVKQGRGFPRIENGVNLLRELVGQFGVRTPVIVMTAHGNDSPRQAIDCMKLGAADYIPKPFPVEGQTLDRAILRALERSGQGRGNTTPANKIRDEPSRPFAGGPLVLFKRRVEVCGVEIPITPVMRRILSKLMEKRPNGKFAAYAGSELIELLRLDCGQNGIASQILEFRNKSIQRLFAEANLQCERDAIIASGGIGYRLREWISVEAEEVISPDDSKVTKIVPGLESVLDGLNERQHWALHQLRQGLELRSRHVVGRFGCSSTTAKRDLAGLKTLGLTRFVGSARAGHYVAR